MKWEYTVARLTLAGVQAELDQLGAEQWELVSVHLSGINWICFLKRPNL